MGLQGRHILAAVLSLLMIASVVPGQVDTTPVLVPDQGTEVPPASEPVAEMHPVKSSVRTWGDVGVHHHDMVVPDVAFNRVFLEYTSWPNHPNGDPWDRTFSVAVNGTELVHGTTTRGNFSIVEDVTDYISWFEPGEIVDIMTKLDTWEDRGIVEDVRFRFYQDPEQVTEAGDHAFDDVVSPFFFSRLGGPGSEVAGEVTFPTEAPERVVLEVFTSGHGGCGEFWYTCPGNDVEPPRMRVYVDDEPVGVVHAGTWVYALLGFDGNDEAGSESEERAALINQHTWWSAHLVLDRAGVHHGVGEIPAYRAEMPAELLEHFTGEKTVKVIKETHAGAWPTSVNVLIDE